MRLIAGCLLSRAVIARRMPSESSAKRTRVCPTIDHSVYGIRRWLSIPSAGGLRCTTQFKAHHEIYPSLGLYTERVDDWLEFLLGEPVGLKDVRNFLGFGIRDGLYFPFSRRSSWS